MEGFARVLFILAAALVAFSADANGARIIHGEGGDAVDRPQTFGSIGSNFPSPIFGGSFPSPLGSSFPGSFPTLGSPSSTGAFPSLGSPSGPSSFCSFPGVLCSPAQPGNPVGSNVGGAPVGAP